MYIMCLQCSENHEITKIAEDAQATVDWILLHQNHTLIFDYTLTYFDRREAALAVAKVQ